MYCRYFVDGEDVNEKEETNLKEDITKQPFEIASTCLGSYPHPGSHTAANNLKRCVEVFSIFGLTVEDLAAVTQDTTGSSINTFDPVEVIFLKIPVMAISANYT